MDKKLTLSFNDAIIEDAKMYAKSNDISLSKLIESYLQTLTKKKSSKPNISPLVKSLSGVISLEKDTNVKDAYTDYLLEKYK